MPLTQYPKNHRRADEKVRVPVARIAAKTAAAVLAFIPCADKQHKGQRGVWIPKSQIHAINEQEPAYADVTAWFAKQKNLTAAGAQ